MATIKEAVKLIKNARYAVAFTGAGISVESGIAPFTGAGGLWNQYDPKFIEINFFETHPKESWEEMKKIFLPIWTRPTPTWHIKCLPSWNKKGC